MDETSIRVSREPQVDAELKEAAATSLNIRLDRHELSVCVEVPNLGEI